MARCVKSISGKSSLVFYLPRNFSASLAFEPSTALLFDKNMVSPMRFAVEGDVRNFG
jgi:hypothetical protein